jgi:hypothetical protein
MGGLAMSIAGNWDLSIATPIGTQRVILALTEHEGKIEGVARGTAETVPLVNPVLGGNRLTWTQTISKPMRLHLAFDVIFEGDTLTGTSKAGLLPASKVTGRRQGTA